MSKFVEAVDLQFIGGIYLRKMSLPAGGRSITHAHAVDHGTVVAKGTGKFWTGIEAQKYEPGTILEVKAGVHHHFVAETDTIVVCVLLEDL
jgi:quercetin dioxygenase-like cupin family protein